MSKEPNQNNDEWPENPTDDFLAEWAAKNPSKIPYVISRDIVRQYYDLARFIAVEM